MVSVFSHFRQAELQDKHCYHYPLHEYEDIGQTVAHADIPASVSVWDIDWLSYSIKAVTNILWRWNGSTSHILAHAGVLIKAERTYKNANSQIFGSDRIS